MVVEDGTGLTDSNSYVSVVFADDYFSVRGVSEWDSLDETSKEHALIRATDFVDNMFQWYGLKASPLQSLRFPRKDLADYEGSEIVGIPNSLKQAVCEAAILTFDGTKLFHTGDENGEVISERIGELSFTYNKRDSGNVASITIYDAINTKLRGLFKDTSRKNIVTGRIERA